MASIIATTIVSILIPPIHVTYSLNTTIDFLLHIGLHIIWEVVYLLVIKQTSHSMYPSHRLNILSSRYIRPSGWSLQA